MTSGLAAAGWGCQPPDAFFRGADAGVTFMGTGGAFGGPGTGGAPGQGGMGLGGRTAGSGGKSGTGGTALGTGGAVTGTGGRIAGTGGAASGTGGSTDGTGGVTGVGGDTGTDAGTVPPCMDCLQVLVQCQASSNNQEFKFVLELANKTTLPIAYADITVRYWYKADLPNDAVTYTTDYTANVSSAAISGTVGMAGANQYLQIAFTSAAGMLAAGANSGQIQARVNAHDPGWNLSQADDYSFMGCPTAAGFTTWNQITAYVAGTLASGVEPTP